MCTCADLCHRAAIEFQAHCMDLIWITGRRLASTALITASSHKIINWSIYCYCLQVHVWRLIMEPPVLSQFACRTLKPDTCGLTPVYLCLIKHTSPWPSKSDSTLVTAPACAVIFRRSSSFQPYARYQIHIDINTLRAGDVDLRF